jgi:hypothetical protein
MLDAVRATLLLADAAQAVAGKLYVLGGGWSTIALGSPSALAVYVQVPWDQTNRRHAWRLELLDSDGNAVVLPGPGGEQAVAIDGAFEIGRPPGLAPGTEQGVPIALQLGPLPLAPGQRYEWRLSIDGEPHDDWRQPFSVIAPQAQPQQPPPAAAT